ncbi:MULTISPECIES: TRAP transporter small permease [unclassified Sporosarcina]|uniref:TRAP transporter small permease n=1 Tax=unclassified Sporosarcina TaxID=2647733 RepID=UPI0013041C6A|nr:MULTISPECIES: TRAP transporter small permease [unclassified Sporosarcina]
MLSVLLRISNLLDSIINFMAILGRVVIIIISLLIIVDIVSLKFFSYQFPWVLEVSEYLLVFLTFLGVAWLLREDGHIKLDLLLNRLSEKNRMRMEILNSCIGAIISLVITVYGFLATWNLHMRDIKTENILEIPRSLLIVVIPVGFLFVFIQFIRNFLSAINKLKSRREKS